MASTEDRVVQMQFSNRVFEKKISQTLDSLTQLNTTIAKLGEKNGFAGLQASADKFNLGGMKSSVEGVSAGFAALATVAITTLANITNRAVDAGITMAKSLTLEPIMDGFREYELNINSIQTILANTKKQGTGLDDVNSALDELNTYSDQTIYNFAQMTKNIGSATAAGVDLDTAVSYVKGFANSAAIAGVDAGSMAGALEQMSQALGSGVIKLQDWISLEKRGLAGQVQQEAFFEVAKAAGTLADVPLDKSFKDWQDEGNTLRASLADGWLTTDVFNDTMKVFTGELSEAELAAMGFSESAIPAMIELGQTGVDAATKVRTLSQFMDVLKESVASGWSASFRTIFGDFEQASETFSNLAEAITGMVGANADARNQVLDDWAALGGRTELIEGIRLTFVNLGKIIQPIREAFRDLFPRKTGEDLYNMTVRFREFAEALEPSGKTLLSLRIAAVGIFAALKGVGEIVGAVAKGFGILLKELLPIGEGALLENTAGAINKIGIAIRNFDEEKIVDWFRDVAEWLKTVPDKFREARDAVKEFIEDLDFGALADKLKEIFEVDISVGNPFGAITGRFEAVANVFEKIIDTLSRAWNSISGLIGDIWDAIIGFFKNIGSGVSDAVATQEFDAATDVVVIGLLSGIALAIKKFLSNGLKLDFGGGFFENISNVFEQLTGVLGAMQAEIKANALLKIAGALALLTVSVVALSFIDSGALTKALTAMAVGFGQLMLAFEALTRISTNPMSAAKLIGIAIGLTVLAGAAALMSVAVRSLAKLDWEELARGTLGLAAVMVIMVKASDALSAQSGDIVRAAGGILVLSIALAALALTMKVFASMDWPEMAKGLLGVGAGLGVIVVAMQYMPSDMAARTAGLMGLAAALLLLSLSVMIFGRMNLVELGKGLIGVGVALAAMGKAIQLMGGVNMAAKATQLLAIGGAMFMIARAVSMLAELSWEEMARGLIGLIGALGIIGATAKLLESSAEGAGGLFLMTLSLKKLKDIIIEFSQVPAGTLASGLIKLAVALGAIAGLAYALSFVIVPMAGLGLALLALGAGFALIGIGANQFAKAFKTLSTVGEAGAKAIGRILEEVGGALPALAKGFALGLLEMGEAILKGMGPILVLLAELIVQVLGVVRDAIPDIVLTMQEFIIAGLGAIREMVPDIVETGWAIIVGLLQGLRDNIGEVIILAGEIVVALLEGLTEAIPTLVDPLIELLVTTLTTVAEAIGRTAVTLGPTIGIALLTGIIQGIKDTWGMLKDYAKEVFNKLIDWVKSLLGISSPSKVFKQIGRWVLEGFVNGLKAAWNLVWTFFTEMPGRILRILGNTALWLVSKGWNIVVGLYNGITDFVNERLIPWLGALPGKVIRWIGDVAGTLVSKGWNFLVGLFNGIINFVNEKLIPWLTSLPSKVVGWIGSTYNTLRHVGANLLIGLWNGIGDKIGWVKDKISGIAGSVVGWVKSGFGIFSPSREFMYIGDMLMEGLGKGVTDSEGKPLGAVENMTSNLAGAMLKGVKEVNAVASMLEADIQPTIRPVMDLTNIEAGARRVNSLVASGSYSTASVIAATRLGGGEATAGGMGGITFEQTINAPKQLSTADIYRQTRNQIELAKEELSIP